MAIFDVHFMPDSGTAQMTRVGTYIMPSLPLHIDIAGDHIVAIEPSSFPFLSMDTGFVHLVRWRDSKRVRTPNVSLDAGPKCLTSDLWTAARRNHSDSGISRLFHCPEHS